jgi:hypothetical protein
LYPVNESATELRLMLFMKLDRARYATSKSGLVGVAQDFVVGNPPIMKATVKRCARNNRFQRPGADVVDKILRCDVRKPYQRQQEMKV